MAPAGELAPMRGLVFAGAILFFLGEAVTACVRVEAPTRKQPSTKNATITVLLDGKPTGQVRLHVRLPGQQGRRSVQTDPDGNAMLTDLPEGTSCLLAVGEHHLTSSLCLDVPKLAATEKSSFYMVLGPATSSLSPEDRIDVLEQSPPSVRVKSLNGTVLDPLGAVIVMAEIQVYRRGAYPRNPSALLKTDGSGRFAASLEPGVYPAIFRIRGFKAEILGVEVVRDGGKRELRQTLQVASDYDW